MTVVEDNQSARPPTGYRQCVRQLAGLQKSSRGASLYARYVNRPLGRRFAAAAHQLGLTPDAVTAASAVLTFGGIVLLAVLRPTLVGDVVLVIVLLLAFALDAADGQLARLRGGGSPAGEWLDHVVDAVKCCSIHLAVLVVAYRYFDVSGAVLLLPLLFAVEASVFYFSIMLTEQLRRGAQGRTARSLPDAAEAAPMLRSVVVLPADYGVLILSFLLLSFSRIFVIVYGAIFAANVIFCAGAMLKWHREMRLLAV